MISAYGIMLVLSGGKMVVVAVYHDGRMKLMAASSTAPARPLSTMNRRH